MTGVAIVTGAGSGIGRSTSLALSKQGYALVLVGRRGGPLLETAEACVTDAIPVAADVGDPAAAERIVTTALERFGRVDALVNNAGTAPLTPIADTTRELLERVFAVNVYGPAEIIARLWPHFVEQGGGTVVNVSSMATEDPFPGFTVYAASKSALESITRSVMQEGEGDGIRAYAVAPGAVETSMLRGLFGEDVLPRAQTLAPERVAEVIVDCVTNRRSDRAGEVIRLPND